MASSITVVQHGSTEEETMEDSGAQQGNYRYLSKAIINSLLLELTPMAITSKDTGDSVTLDVLPCLWEVLLL